MINSKGNPYHLEIEQFCSRVITAFQPDCVILHGSVARQTNTPTSDIDIIVIGGNLPTNFFERSYQLNSMRDGIAPLEVVSYTLLEWQQMMEDFHLTTLEALHWGIPLHGKKLFKKWQVHLEKWKGKGLRRNAFSWVVPNFSEVSKLSREV